jgi:hypothetical protein
MDRRTSNFGFLSLLTNVLDDSSLEVIQGLELCTLVPEDVALCEPRKPFAALVAHEAAGWYSKDVVEFFQGALLVVMLAKSRKKFGGLLTLVSGIQRKIMTNATRFSPAKNAKVSVDPKEERILGNVRPRTAAQKRHVATAQPIPTSRCDSGKTSAE